MSATRRTPLELAVEAEKLQRYADDPPWVVHADSVAVERVLTRHERVVLGLDALSTASAQQLREHGGWWPLLPLAECGEVVTVQGMVADGELGQLRELDVTVLYGPPPWDPQPTELHAASPFEAAAWALHLVEHVTGSRCDLDGRTCQGDGSAWVATVRTDDDSDGAVVRLRVLPADAVPGPTFTATAWFVGGHVLLRDPFSPGRVAVWDARRSELRSGNGRPLGPRAGNNAWPAEPLRRALRWAAGGDAAHADLVGLRAKASDLVTRLADHGPGYRAKG